MAAQDGQCVVLIVRQQLLELHTLFYTILSLISISTIDNTGQSVSTYACLECSFASRNPSMQRSRALNSVATKLHGVRTVVDDCCVLRSGHKAACGRASASIRTHYGEGVVLWRIPLPERTSTPCALHKPLEH